MSVLPPTPQYPVQTNTLPQNQNVFPSYSTPNIIKSVLNQQPLPTTSPTPFPPLNQQTPLNQQIPFNQNLPNTMPNRLFDPFGYTTPAEAEQKTAVVTVREGNIINNIYIGEMTNENFSKFKKFMYENSSRFTG
jgi:hypothetical protein